MGGNVPRGAVAVVITSEQRQGRGVVGMFAGDVCRGEGFDDGVGPGCGI